jgi:hypothetical protein
MESHTPELLRRGEQAPAYLILFALSGLAPFVEVHIGITVAPRYTHDPNLECGLHKEDRGPLVQSVVIWAFMILPPQRGMESCDLWYFLIPAHVYLC